MLKLTETAAKQVKLAAKNGDMEGLALRIAVRKDNDGAFEYGVGFDETKDDDVTVAQEGFQVVYSPAYIELLRDAVMDYVEIEPGQFHFIFLNPNDPNYVPPK